MRDKSGVFAFGRFSIVVLSLILFSFPSPVPAEPIRSPAAQDVGEYRVGVGDVLRVRIYSGGARGAAAGEDERVTRVRPDGKISVELVGSVHVLDFTPTQIGEILKLRLKKFYRDPDVTVFVDEFVSQKVLVIGNVKQPGTYSLMGDDRVLDLLARAGWISAPPVAGADEVVLLRDNSRESFFLSDILNNAKLDQNRVLRRGDILYVVASGEKGMVRVQGEVQKPGAVWMEREPMWVTDAVTAAGGVTGRAESSRAFLIRADGTHIPFDLEKVLQGKLLPNAAPKLRDGDILYVPQSVTLGVFVLGMVRAPGKYDLPEGSRVIAAIARAGYHVPGAVLNSTRLVRVSPTGQTKVFNIQLERLLHDKQFDNDMELADGDVVFVPKSVISNVGDFWEKVWPLVRVNIQNVAAPHAD